MSKVKLLFDVISDVRSLADSLQAVADAIAENEPATVDVKEVEAPKQYVISTAVHTLKIKAGQTTTVNVSDNDSVTAKIKLNKVDKETGRKTPQGDASLAGAVYGLYAREAIVHPDGTTGTIYKKRSIGGNDDHQPKGRSRGKKSVSRKVLCEGNYSTRRISGR